MNSNHSSNETKKTIAEEPVSQIEISLPEIFKAFQKFWWLCLLLAVIGAGVMFYRSYVRFRPVYKSSVTFTVQTQNTLSSNMGITSYSFSYNRATANQLSSTFPNIIKSNILQDIVCNDLGLAYFPCSLSASSVSGTNMFTITATGSDPQTTYDVLQSVIKNYPTVAEYVIGNTNLDILNPPEVPTVPSNQLDYQSRMLKGAFIGFFAAIVWIVIYAMMRQTVRSRNDIRQKLNQHCLGVLPEVVFKKYNKKINHSILITNPMVGESYLESIRAFRNSVMNTLGDKQVIMVTSTAPGEGKTSTAVNLALSLAAMKKNVIIVDADIRNPNVSARLGMDVGKNDDLGSNIIKITKLKINSITTLSVLKFNTEHYDNWKILNYEHLMQLFRMLRERYDYIVVDTSPLGLTSDPAAISPVADAAILVVKQDTIRVSRIKSSIDTLLSSGVELIGCVMNGASTGFVGYGGKYGYRYGSYGKYGYGYGYGKEKQRSKTEESQ